jgi:hypothetical protein
MLKPLWPPLFPPAPSGPQIFTLPRVPSLLWEVYETPTEREERVREVRRCAFKFYQAVGRHLGEEDAKKLFDYFISEPRAPGRPSGPTDPEAEEKLVAIYDNFRREGASPMAVARWLFARPGRGQRFGKSPEAVAKHIQRLLRKRERRRALDEARYRRIMQARARMAADTK